MGSFRHGTGVFPARTRRRLAALPLVLAVLVGVVGGPPERPATGFPGPASDQARLRRTPNIVVVMTDDQDLESVQFMPNVRRLIADKGVTFERHTAAFSLCCPSRASFLTGQHGHNNGVRDNLAPNGGYAKLNAAETLPVWLQRAGYATGHIGKYPNGYNRDSHPETKGVPPGWDDWRGTPEERAYYYYGYLINENGTLKAYGELPDDYQNDVVTRLATNFVRERAPASKPFFLSVNYLAPHWELYPGSLQNPNPPLGLLNPIKGQPFSESETFAPPVPAPRHKEAFAGVKAPRPPSYDEADVSDKPSAIQRRPRLSQEQQDRIDRWYQLRLESLLSVDEGIATLVRVLEEQGKLHNTVIMFTSDNGWMQGEHRLPDGKIVHYEASTRIPLIARGPGVDVPGGRVSDWTSNVDVTATILEIAHAVPGVGQDGTSLRPYMSDPATSVGRAVLHESQPPGDPRAFTAVRAGRWKYVEYPGVTYDDVRERELYDLVADPHELTSLHNDPALAPLRAQLATILKQLRECKGADCVVTGFPQ